MEGYEIIRCGRIPAPRGGGGSGGGGGGGGAVCVAPGQAQPIGPVMQRHRGPDVVEGASFAGPDACGSVAAHGCEEEALG